MIEKNVSLADFSADEKYTETNNGQVWRIPGLGADPENMLAVAKENIRNHFMAVGLMERFDENLILFKNEMRWQTPYYITSNATPGRKHSSEISSTMRGVTREKSAADLALYDYVEARLDIESGAIPGYARQLLLLQAINPLHRLWENVRAAPDR